LTAGACPVLRTGPQSRYLLALDLRKVTESNPTLTHYHFAHRERKIEKGRQGKKIELELEIYFNISIKGEVQSFRMSPPAA
jgi:hypothetical protein